MVPPKHGQYTVYMNKLLQAARTSGKLVFPPNPSEVGQQWFLRTPINPVQARELLSIRINPSTATRLQTKVLTAIGRQK